MQIEEYKISEMKNAHAELFLDHMERQVAENGQGETPIFTAIEPATFERDADAMLERWNADLSAPGWTRNWIAWDDGRIIGNIQLDGARYPSEKHRVDLSMAIELDQRAKGLGTRLMITAIEWASKNGFDWVDLGVFADNTPAIHLYEKFDFVRTGCCRDKSRILGKKVDLISMTKSLTKNE